MWVLCLVLKCVAVPLALPSTHRWPHAASRICDHMRLHSTSARLTRKCWNHASSALTHVYVRWFVSSWLSAYAQDTEPFSCGFRLEVTVSRHITSRLTLCHVKYEEKHCLNCASLCKGCCLCVRWSCWTLLCVYASLSNVAASRVISWYVRLNHLTLRSQRPHLRVLPVLALLSDVIGRLRHRQHLGSSLCSGVAAFA